MSGPYGNDAQIFTFGVHGTNNTPDNVRDVTRRISAAVGTTTDGPNLWDNGFDWRARQETIVIPAVNMLGEPIPRAEPDRLTRPVEGTAHQLNQTRDRDMAAERLSAHVLQQVDNALGRGELDRNTPLTINLVGFSHGGNVALLATQDIAEGLRQRGIDSAIHVATLSTPAYTRGPENPDAVRDQAQANGVRFAHTHFATPGDNVQRGAIGNPLYPTQVTRNFEFEDMPSRVNPIVNHGAVQNVPEMMDRVAETLRQRFNGLAPAHDRSSVEGDLRVAGAAQATGAAGTSDWAALSQNPLIRDATTALGRLSPDVAREDLDRTLIVAAAGAAAQNRMTAIQEVMFNPDRQEAFVINRDSNNPDPAARIARIDLASVNQPLERVVERYAPALQDAQTQQQTQALAAQQEPETARQGRQV